MLFDRQWHEGQCSAQVGVEGLVFWLKWEMHNRSAYPNTYVTEGTVLTSDINISKCRYGDLEDRTDILLLMKY